MNKILKYLGLAFATFLLIIICLFAYIKFAFDPNQFKSDIVQLVQEKKQRTLVIEGDITLSLFPKIGVDLGKLSLSAHKSNAAFASLQKAHVSLAFLPLLKKQLIIDQILLDGVTLSYERNQDGTSNIDDLLSNDDEKSNTKMQFDVQGIDIKNAQLSLSDMQNALHLQAKNVQFSSGRLADKTPTQLQFSAQIISSKPQADTLINVKSQLYFDLQEQIFKLDEFDFSLNGVLENKKLETVLQAKSINSNLQKKTFSLSDFKSTGKTQLADGAAQVSLQSPSIQLSESSVISKEIKGDFSLMGVHHVKGNFNLQNITGDVNNIKLEKLLVTADAEQLAKKFKAQLQSGVEIDLKEQRFYLPRFQIDADIHDPSLAQPNIKLPIKGELTASLKTKTIRSQLTSQFDESKINATMTMLGFDQAAFAFTVDIDQINVDKYLGSKNTSKEKIPAINKAKGEGEETKIDLSALKTFNANGKITIGKLQVANVKMNAVHIPLRAKNGKIDLTDFSAQLYQGAVKGNLNVDANNNQIQIQQNMSDIRINPFMQDLLNKDVVEGKGDVVMNLRTQGNTIGALKRALDGSVSLKLVDGAVKGINLAKTLRDFKSKILGKTDQQQSVNTLEKTDFSALSASIQFNDGIGQSDDLQLQSPFLRVGGSGNVNLHKDALDYVAKVTVVNTATGQEGKDLAQLKDLTIPIRLYGPFDKIAYQLQFSQISSEALKSVFKEKAAPVIEEKKKELEEKLKNSLRDKLKGLF